MIVKSTNGLRYAPLVVGTVTLISVIAGLGILTGERGQRITNNERDIGELRQIVHEWIKDCGHVR